VDVQRELLTLLEKRLATGFASAPEVSAVRLALFRAESAAVDAANQQTVARTHAAAALGLPLVALAGVTLPPPPAATALSTDALTAARRQSLQSRADVLAALAKIQSTEAALALEAAKQQPDFHLGPGYQWDQGLNKWSVAFTFELPLFHRNEGPIAEATGRRGEAVAQFNAVQAQAVAAIESAATAQVTAAKQLEHAGRMRTEVEQQNALAQQRLARGAADQVERQTARLDLAVADAALADAESAAALAAGQLEDALQIPFPNLTALAPATAGGAQPSRTP
jgi:outer membrane protein TolC